MYDESQQHLFSSNERSELFPETTHGGAFEHQYFDHNGTGFNYVHHYASQPPAPSLYQEFGFLSESARSSIEKFSEHNKTIHGLHGFVTLEPREKGQNILDRPLNSIVNEIDLPHLFNESVEDRFPQLQKSLGEIKKIFANSHSSNLCENFENFVYLQENNKHQFFHSRLQESYFQMVRECAKKKRGEELMQSLFDSWVSCFQNLLYEIEKCSPLYTLDMFKKQTDNRFAIEVEEEKLIPLTKDNKKPIAVSPSQNGSMLPRTTSYIQEAIGDDFTLDGMSSVGTERRKPWSEAELQKLNQLIKENDAKTIPSAKIQELAAELNRSVTAVQSRIQKIHQSKKLQQQQLINNLGGKELEAKVIDILRKSQFGMTKQQVIAAINPNYNASSIKLADDTLNKTIMYILTNSRNISKVKGTYALKQGLPAIPNISNFKNKVAWCLMEFPLKRAELKLITRKYIQKYGRDEGITFDNADRVKNLQANILKTLTQYEMFECSKAKTIYQHVLERESSSTHSQSDKSETESIRRR